MKTIIGSSSPTFVATFAHGTISRRKQSPPALTAGHFETPPNGDGCAAVVLRIYTADN
jgi:hypothetical protein